MKKLFLMLKLIAVYILLIIIFALWVLFTMGNKEEETDNEER